MQVGLFTPQIIVQEPPAQPSDEKYLFCNSGGLRDVSHASSSICARSVPLCPTIDKKTCSSVLLLPASPAKPARNSSSEPCATRRPVCRLPTVLARRSTMSSTC